MSKTILVTGATGKQGGSTIRAILAKNIDADILAVTRDANSASAKRLASSSPRIKLVEGNLDDPKSIFAKAKEVTRESIWGVFSIQTVPMNKKGPQIEETQGKALVDAALANKVQHFVYTSVDRHGDRSITNPTRVPHFISKHNIERHLMAQASSATTMRWTILRPVAFMDNLQPGFATAMFSTAIRDIVSPKSLQFVATDDIGFFAAEAFAKPDEYAGRTLSLAGDDLTFDQLNAVFQRKTGRPVPTTYSFVVKLIMWFLSHDLGAMIHWFHEEGYNADIEALRKVHPGLKTLDDYLDGSAFVKK